MKRKPYPTFAECIAMGNWYNELQKVWHIQIGFEIIKSYKSLGACKSWITKELNKKG